MINRTEELARRKEALIARCAQEREELASFCRRYHAPLEFGKALLSFGTLLKSHPLWVAGVSGLLVSGRGRGLARVGLELLGLWRALLPLWTFWKEKRGPKPALSVPPARR